MTMPNPSRVKKKLPKVAKIAIWVGASIVAVFIAITVAGLIAIGNQPGGWDAELAKQESQSSAKASQKAADAAAQDKVKLESDAKAKKDSDVSAKASAKADAARSDTASAKAGADAAQAAKSKAAAEAAAKSKTDAEAAAIAKVEADEAKAKAETAAITKAKAAAADKAKTDAAASKAAAAKAKQAAGKKYFDAWLESRGASTSAEVLLQSPDNLQGYLVSAESPVSGTAVFTAQVTKGEFSKADYKQAAMAVLQLVGYGDDSLDRVEIVSADSLDRGVANRRDSPLLNMNK